MITFPSPIFTEFDVGETLFAEFADRPRASLSGLTSIYPVVIENPHFDQELLTEAIEQLLSNAGIPVRAEGEASAGTGG